MKIAFLFDPEPTYEQIQAYKWVRARTGCAFKVEIDEIFRTNLYDFNIIWWHYDKNLTLPEIVKDENFRSILLDFLKNGGNLLLTLSAMKLLNEIQIEPVEPDFEGFEIDFNPRGFVSFFGHPIFRKLQNGVNVYLPRYGDKFLTVAYVKQTPEKLKVIAVEKIGDEIKLEKKILFEYEDNGRVIGIGGNVYFSVENKFFYNLDRFVLNSLLYLNNPKKFPEPRTYWSFHTKVEQINLKLEDKALRSAQKKIGERGTGISLEEGDAFFIQGRGIYARVSKSEIGQVSIPPFQFIEYLKIYVRDALGFLVPQNVRVVFKPESVLREFEIGGVKFKENIFTHPKKPILILNFLMTSEVDFEICFELKISPKILNSPIIPFKNFSFGYEEKLKSVYVFNDSYFSLFCGSSRKPELVEFETDEDLIIKIFYKIFAGVEKAFNFAVVGEVKQPFSSEDVINVAKWNYKFALMFPHKVFKESFKFVKDRFRKHLLILTPNEKLNENFKFSVALVPKFIKSVKTLGDFAIDELNKFDVDLKKVFKVLSVMLKIGEYDGVRDTLEFVGRYINLNGEIPSRFSLFGVFEYGDEKLKWDYIKICADYLRCSKDKLFAKFTWRRLKRMFKNYEVEKIERDIVNSLFLFAKILKDEEWIEKLSGFGVGDVGNLDIGKGQEVNFGNCFDVNSAFSVSGFIDGVLSKYCVFDVDSFAKKIYSSPFVKNEWEFLEIRNLRIQNMSINVFVKREDNWISFLFEKRSLPEVKVIFEPRFEGNVLVEKVMIDDKSVQSFRVEGNRVMLEFPFRFKRAVYLLIHPF